MHCSMAVTSEPMSVKEVAEPYRPRFAECEFRYGMIIIVPLTSTKQTRVKRLVYSAVMDGLSVSPSAIDVGKCFQLCYAAAGRNPRARRSCLRRMNDRYHEEIAEMQILPPSTVKYHAGREFILIGKWEPRSTHDSRGSLGRFLARRDVRPRGASKRARKPNYSRHSEILPFPTTSLTV